MGGKIEEKIKVRVVRVGDYLTPTKVPVADFVINPYVGCPHACKYCYACFMRRFTGHQEPWGKFLDVKAAAKPISLRRLAGKSVTLSTVTDAYNSFEAKYKVTRGILEQLADADCELSILTKSPLVERDADLLRRMKNASVAMSIWTLDESDRRAMEAAPSSASRLAALRRLRESGVRTELFLSPIFPGLTDWRAIIDAAAGFVDEFWIENLNLRPEFRGGILSWIRRVHTELTGEYARVFGPGADGRAYWDSMARDIADHCARRGVALKNWFHHAEVRKK